VIAESIRVTGIVQGVGFRPTVYRLAIAQGLRGSVCNEGSGVQIVVAGNASQIHAFVQALKVGAPPLARIDAIEREPCDAPSAAGFHIAASRAGVVRAELSADAATCAACLAEVRDPAARRWQHPFANCTHCGPRLSIVRALPYDRAHTSMAAFAMCDDCRREYGDPADRRFHAQPIACPQCGPRLRCEPEASDALRQTAAWLCSGRIVAIKGIGGYHLACDASDEAAIARLRSRKRRPAKPFALMARDAAMVERYCTLSAAEREWLESRAAPIVLLAADGPTALPATIARGQTTLGFMLPYSALHHLLMDLLDGPIVLTSGNAAGEPQCIDDDDARNSLREIADAFLWHDRAIVSRVDDSVMRVVAGTPRVLRLGRGLAPHSIALPAGFDGAPEVLALGGELKNTICLLRRGRATLSQHIGDLTSLRNAAAFRAAVALYGELFEHRAQVIAIDCHPDHRAGLTGRERAAAEGLTLIEVQHHHAHIAVCLAEHGVPLDAPPVLGIALDGLGYGDDGTLWGGEFLRADYRSAERIASLAPVTMPGGEQAIREPWRMTWAYLTRHPDATALQREHAALPFFRELEQRPWRMLEAAARRGINCPVTTSCGRLFDAVSALVGLCSHTSYEGQAAIELEACVDADALQRGEAYTLALAEDRIDSTPMWPQLLADLSGKVPVGVIAARFHLGLVHALAAMAGQLTRLHGDPWDHRIALGGGVFQNACLLAALTHLLEADGFTVWSPSRVPMNDGGLSLGQAVVAAARSKGANKVTTTCASASRPR
jgi:hydrogenase maturation protein HypF